MSVDGYSTSAPSCCGVSVAVARAGSQTHPITQCGPAVPAAVALVSIGPVTQGAVGVAGGTFPQLRVLVETLRTVEQTEAVV